MLSLPPFPFQNKRHEPVSLLGTFFARVTWNLTDEMNLWKSNFFLYINDNVKFSDNRFVSVKRIKTLCRKYNFDFLWLLVSATNNYNFFSVLPMNKIWRTYFSLFQFSLSQMLSIQRVILQVHYIIIYK